MALPVLAAAPAGVDLGNWLAACAAVRAYCRWHIAPSVSEVLTLDGSGCPIQFLPTLRLTALTSITNDGVVVTDPEWSQAGMVRGPRCWSPKWRSVVATITHGYDECPAEVAQVITDMVKLADLVGVGSVQAGPFQTTPAPNAIQAGAVGLSQEQKRILDAYRLALIP